MFFLSSTGEQFRERRWASLADPFDCDSELLTRRQQTKAACGKYFNENLDYVINEIHLNMNFTSVKLKKMPRPPHSLKA